MDDSERLPTAFESFAAINKFIAVKQVSPAFYQKHWKAIESASAFIRILASTYPSLEVAFRNALPLELEPGGVPIQQAIFALHLPPEKVKWLDAQMTVVLKQLVRVIRDDELPEWLWECRWGVEGAFYGG